MAYVAIIALMGGFLPSFVWLFFWLMEDRLHPESRMRIALTFFGGATMVLLAIPLEHIVSTSLADPKTVFWWSITEESLKFIAAGVFGLLTADYDEPIDALVYTITAALGFAAAENALFLFGTLLQGGASQSILIGDTRFVGSTLLHTVSSACIGISMALTFFRSRAVQTIAIIIGVILSVFLHMAFNLFILQQGGGFFFALIVIWIGVVVVLAFAERIKHLTSPPRK